MPLGQAAGGAKPRRKRANTPSPVNKAVLQQSDFTYEGYFELPALSGVQTEDCHGLCGRVVGGQFRLMTMPRTTIGHETIHEFVPVAIGESVASLTRQWKGAGIVYSSGTPAWPTDPFVQTHFGLYYDPVTDYVFTCRGDDYPDDNGRGSDPLHIRAVRLNETSNGAYQDIKGRWGFTGIGNRNAYGGFCAIPEWFQTAYSTGNLLAGFGGYASREQAYLTPSLGPAFFAFENPVTAGSSNESTVSFKTLANSAFSIVGANKNGYCLNVDRSSAYGAGGVYDRTLLPSNPIVSEGPAYSNTPVNGRIPWVLGDSYWGCGVWIDNTTKHGMVCIGSFADQWCGYYESYLRNTATTVEIQVFDPLKMGEVADGARDSWNVLPDHQWKIGDSRSAASEYDWPDGWVGNPGNPTDDFTYQRRRTATAAAYDSATRTLYILSNTDDRTVLNSRIYVYTVAA